MRNILTNVKQETGRLVGCTKGDEGSEVMGIGQLKGSLKHNDIITPICIREVKVTENLDESLLRVQALENLGLRVDFGQKKILRKTDGAIVAEIEEDYYSLPYIWIYTNDGTSYKTAPALQHKRNGHLGEGTSSCTD